MCGICGIVHDESGRVDKALLEKANDLIDRGPDDFGFYVDEYAGLVAFPSKSGLSPESEMESSTLLPLPRQQGMMRLLLTPIFPVHYFGIIHVSYAP